MGLTSTTNLTQPKSTLACPATVRTYFYTHITQYCVCQRSCIPIAKLTTKPWVWHYPKFLHNLKVLSPAPPLPATACTRTLHTTVSVYIYLSPARNRRHLLQHGHYTPPCLCTFTSLLLCHCQHLLDTDVTQHRVCVYLSRSCSTTACNCFIMDTAPFCVYVYISCFGSPLLVIAFIVFSSGRHHSPPYHYESFFSRSLHPR